MADDTRCANCGFPVPAVELRDDLIRDQQQKIRTLKARVSTLQGERAVDQQADPFLPDAVKVFDHWKLKLSPKAKEFNGERFEKVRARLAAGLTVEELRQAIDGCALRPYVTDTGRTASGRPDQRHAELSLICRDEAHVRRFQSYAEAVAAERGSTPDLIPAKRLAALQTALDAPDVLARIGELRGWSAKACLSLGLGLEGGRIVFPIHDGGGKLVGLCRYQPNKQRRSGPKMVAEGDRNLFPPPETLDSTSCWLVEGEPDAVAIHSAGLPGVAVPGVNTWKRGWAERFERFERVYIAFDCDEEGRRAAEARSQQLAAVTSASIVELDPSRDDEYDIGDFLLDHGEGTSAKLASLVVKRSSNVTPLRKPKRERLIHSFDDLCARLEDHGCKVRHLHPGQASSQCPNHDDRQPSLSVSEGDDGRLLLHCHAGCKPEEIIAALGLEWGDLFGEAANA